MPHSGGTPNVQKGTKHKINVRKCAISVLYFPGVQYSTGQGIIAECLSARQIIVLHIRLEFVCIYVCISITVLLRPRTYIGSRLHQVRHILRAFGVDFILGTRLPTSWTCLGGRCSVVSALQLTENAAYPEKHYFANSFNIYLAILRLLTTMAYYIKPCLLITPTNYIHVSKAYTDIHILLVIHLQHSDCG